MKLSNMTFYTYRKYLLLLFAFSFLAVSGGWAQTSDQLPVREYTNPEEVVTFDRTTSFSRALDVVNQFSQQYRGKMVLDRSGIDGNIGISIPPMHWMDALKMMLNVKRLRLVEQPEYYEIVSPQQSHQNQASGNTTASAQTGEGSLVSTGTREVRINAIFFEGNRRALSELGVDWSTLSENVPESILGNQGGGQGGGDGAQIPSSEFDGPFVQVNSKGAQNVSQSVFDALVNFGEVGNSGIQVQALFSAFEADNLGEILASPTVKVMDGEEGRIQVGQDFSIKQRDFAGNVVEQFFSVGTILTVTPQIIEQQDTTFIHLDITAERSSAQPDPVSTVINKTQAQTQSLLMDEEATVIAGLYRTEYAEVRRGVPILKDLPGWFFGLKYLFGYTSQDQLTRELVIVLQATIEPSIPERYGREYRDRFQILEDERYRMQDEIKRSQHSYEGEPVDETTGDEFEPEVPDSNQEKNEYEESRETAQATEDTTGYEKQEKESETDAEPDSTVITDPELNRQEIELDLGGEANKDTATVDKPSAETEAVNKNSNGMSQFYIIGGSFRLKENAQNFSNELRKEGYNPVIISNPQSESQLVAYDQFSSRNRAKKALLQIQQQHNSAAWLFVAE